MFIKCWGSRGAIPVSGSGFIRYGGDTTCVEVRSENGDLLILDAGSGIRALGDKLINNGIENIHLLFTHLHLDHIMGFPFFAPIYKRGVKITAYGCPFRLSSFSEAIHGIMRAPYFPVDLKKLSSNLIFKDIQNRSFKIGSMNISPVYLNHPNGGLGFRIEENGRVFVFLTDNELGDDLPGSQPLDLYIEFCKGADLLFHDAEFTVEEYARFKTWGHSSVTDTVELGLQAEVKRLGLFHINNRRTDKQLDDIVEESKLMISKKSKKMKCFAVGNTFEITI
jgi:phosphoribosyl 1,2-cyclic phosphodiesterase